MRKKYVVTLSDAQRAELRARIRKGTTAARTLARARVLLLADEGRTDEQIATSVHVGTTTVERLRRRFVEEGLDATCRNVPAPAAYPNLMGNRKPCWSPWRAVNRPRTT